MKDSKTLGLTSPQGGGASASLYVHSTESFGSVDGPGIRFIIFLKGCHMRCRYCHNPDTWRMAGAEEKATTVTELLDQAERYRAYWGDKGGITVSGGEALLQIDGLIALFEEAHRRGINTCLDTAAQPFTHRQLTGHGNENILDCARCLSDLGVPVWIRHVLVPGVTDDEDQLHRLRAFIDTLNNVERVEVLPYHTLGVYKWEELGIPYTLKDVPTPSKEQVACAEEILCGK